MKTFLLTAVAIAALTVSANSFAYRVCGKGQIWTYMCGDGTSGPKSYESSGDAETAAKTGCVGHNGMVAVFQTDPLSTVNPLSSALMRLLCVGTDNGDARSSALTPVR